MKLHYYNLLLFCLPLNILVHNKNKAYVTPHTTITSRVLSESDVPTSIYDNDADMKSVKENFDRKTSERFKEYNKRMNDKRKKFKDQCDKDIQKIIVKDEKQKSLAEKVEKGCLKCGCGLGSVGASVGIFGPIAINELKKTALIAATQAAIADSAAEGAAKGAAAGAAEVIAGLEKLGIDKLFNKPLGTYISAANYNQDSYISAFVNMQYMRTCKSLVHGGLSNSSDSICDSIVQWGLTEGSRVNVLPQSSIAEKVTNVVTRAKPVAEAAAKTATEEVMPGAIKTSTAAVDATYAIYQTAIIASVVAILVIVLVMIIIYLVLRYRRKKNMNKKQQYTKLLNS
ncbi:PIR protein, putative [Plasmodium sp.]|nr:PIR protein, putative [Plasmodium sp.]